MKKLSLLVLLTLVGCGGGGGASVSTNSGPGGNLPVPTGPTRVLKWVNQPKASGVNPQVLIAPAGLNSLHVHYFGEAVSFLSDATDLVASDSNGGVDLFHWERVSELVRRDNILDSATQSPTNVTSYAYAYNGSSLAFSLQNSDNNPAGPPYFLITDAGVENGRGQVCTVAGGLAFYETRATNDSSEPVRIAVSNGSRFPDGSGVNFPLIFFPHANGDCRRPQPDENTVRLFFYSEADNLVANDDNGVGDIFCYFREEDRIVRISEGADGSSFNAATSVGQPTFDGRYYVFATEASNVVPGDSNGVSDVFLKDVDTGQVTLLSAGLNGQPGNGPSTNPTVDHYADRTYFSSSATNLVENDNNGMTDIFVYDRSFSRVIGRVNFDLDGAPPHGGSNSPQLCSVSRDGAWVAFTSDAAYSFPGLRVGDRNLYLTNSNIDSVLLPDTLHFRKAHKR